MFDSVQLKIERADHHIADLKRQFESFVARKPYRFGIGHDPETGQPIIQIRFVESVPKTFAGIIGDAVHNLRSALDHLTWDVVGYDDKIAIFNSLAGEPEPTMSWRATR